MSDLLKSAIIAAGCVFCANSYSSETSIPWQSDCQQIVLVTSEAWESTSGLLFLWEREEGKPWKAKTVTAQVVLGKKGTGVGIGFHDHKEFSNAPQKMEGDLKAPAGIFALESGFGKYKQPAGTKNPLDYLVVRGNHIWVDDPNSRYYNRLVDLADRSISKDWNSAERLLRSDSIYQLVVVIGHNRRKEGIIPRRGSAIFIHSWAGETVPTSGCTAMQYQNVEALWRWLDRDKQPVIIQGPTDFLKKLDLPQEIRRQIER